jgi:hypothetical protein
MSRLRLYIASSSFSSQDLRKAEGDGTLQGRSTIADAPAPAPAAGVGGASGGGGAISIGGGNAQSKNTVCPFGGGQACRAAGGGSGGQTHEPGSDSMPKHQQWMAEQLAQGSSLDKLGTYKDKQGNEQTLSMSPETAKQLGVSDPAWASVFAEQAKKKEGTQDPLTGETSKPVGADDPLAATPESSEPSDDKPDPFASTAIAEDPTGDATSPGTPLTVEGKDRPISDRPFIGVDRDSRLQKIANQVGQGVSRADVQRLDAIDGRGQIAQRDYKNLTSGKAGLSDEEAKSRLKGSYSDEEISVFLKEPDKPFNAAQEYNSAENKEQILKLSTPATLSEAAAEPASTTSVTEEVVEVEAPTSDETIADKPFLADPDKRQDTAQPDPDTSVTEEVVEVEAPTSGDTIADKPFLADPDKRFNESVDAGRTQAAEYHDNLPSSHQEALQAHENLVAQHEKHLKGAKAHSENRTSQIASGTKAIVNAQHEEALKKYQTQQKAHNTRENNREEKHKAKQAELEEAHKAKQDELEEAHKAKIDAEYAAKFDAVKKEMIDAHAAAEPKEVKQITSQKEMFETDAWNKAEEAFRGGKDGHPGAAPKKPSLGKEPAKSADKSIRDKWKKKKKAYDAAMKTHPTVLRNHSNGRKSTVETYLAEHTEKLNRFDVAFDKFKKEKLKELNEPYEKYNKLKKEWQAKNPDKNKPNRNKMEAEIVSRIGKKDYSGFEREEFKRKEFKPKKFNRKSPLKSAIDKKSVKAKVTAEVDKKLGPAPEVPAGLRDAKGNVVNRKVLDSRRPRAPQEINTDKHRVAHQAKVGSVQQSISRAKEHLAARQDLSDADRRVAHQAIKDLSFSENVQHLHTPDQNKKIRSAQRSLKDLKMHVAYKEPKVTADAETPQPPSNDVELASALAHNEKSSGLLTNLQAHLDSGTLSDSERSKVSAVMSGMQELSELETVPTKQQKAQLRQLSQLAGKHGRPVKASKEAKAPRAPKAAAGPSARLGSSFASGQSRGRQLAQAATPDGASQGVEAVTGAATSAVGGIARTGHRLLKEARKDNEAKNKASSVDQPGGDASTSSPPVQKSIYISNKVNTSYNLFVTEGIH